MHSPLPLGQQSRDVEVALKKCSIYTSCVRGHGDIIFSPILILPREIFNFCASGKYNHMIQDGSLNDVR